MASFTKFEEIIAWQKARELCKLFDVCYKKYPDLSKNFKLSGQMDAFSGSVMDNIAVPILYRIGVKLRDIHIGGKFAVVLI
jgi:23S rRNA-intervening sequence protein